MERVRDAGQPAQGWESQLCFWAVVKRNSMGENSSPCYEQDLMYGILPLLTKKHFDRQAGAHSAARESPSLAQSNFLLQTPRTWSTGKHTSLISQAHSGHGMEQITGHTENLQAITHNDYSERELASKPFSPSSSLNLAPSLFLSLLGAFKKQRVSEYFFPPVASHQKSTQEEGMVEPQGKAGDREQGAGPIQLCPSSSS